MVLALDAQVLDKVSLGVDFRAWGLGLRVDNGDSTKELKTFAAGLQGKAEDFFIASTRFCETTLQCLRHTQ